MRGGERIGEELYVYAFGVSKECLESLYSGFFAFQLLISRCNSSPLLFFLPSIKTYLKARVVTVMRVLFCKDKKQAWHGNIFYQGS